VIHLTALLVSQTTASSGGADMRVISTGTTITTTPSAGTG
jgi:hypothetical protein